MVSNDAILIAAAVFLSTRTGHNEPGPGAIANALMDAREIERELDRFNRRVQAEPPPVMMDEPDKKRKDL